MKFLRFLMADVEKAADIAQIGDKMWSNPPPGAKMLELYICGGIAFPGQPTDKYVAIGVFEMENAEAIIGTSYPAMLAGANIWWVPVQEVPVSHLAEGDLVDFEKKLKG